MNEIKNDYKKGMTYKEWKLTDEGKYYFSRSNQPTKQNQRIGSKLHELLKYKDRKRGTYIIEEMGYSAVQLYNHLKSCGWEKGINEIDHKIPQSWFTDEVPIHIVHHLDNLQCLTHTENLSKGAHFAAPVKESYYHESFPFIKSMYKQSIYYVLQKE